MIASFAFADVTAEILNMGIDENGNIMVKTQYKIDGIEVKSRYPKLDGKYYFVTRYDCMNFQDMTKEEIKDRVLSDVKEHSKSLVAREYIKKKNADIFCDFPDIQGTTNTESEGSLIIDTDKDGEPDTEWVVKTNGEKTIHPYIPASIK